MDYFKYDVVYAMNITDVDDKVGEGRVCRALEIIFAYHQIQGVSM